MSAAEAIHDRIHGPGHCEPPCGLCREVTGLLEDYAHELAEKQRDYAEEQWAGDKPALIVRRVIAGRVADLIDPEVLNSGS